MALDKKYVPISLTENDTACDLIGFFRPAYIQLKSRGTIETSLNENGQIASILKDKPFDIL
ncbi:MAG: hypothetical protein K2Z81_25760 [Cyanobacteria bacterium]|nr:hypothetical protein [Cyanobacteriota bacterium]